MNQSIIKASLNPLGELDQSLKEVASFANEELVILFQEILIDLPCSDYFRKFIDD